MRLRNPWTLTKEQNLNLPVPRLEIRQSLLDNPVGDFGYNVKAEYGMVYEHLTGETIFVPLGSTNIGANLSRYDFMGLPFRDGAHIIHDMFMLKLRGFVVYQDKFKELFISDDTIPGGLRTKMQKDLK